MNKVTIDRELLEQVASEFEHDNDRYMLGRELRKVLDAPRQPEVDAQADIAELRRLLSRERGLREMAEADADGLFDVVHCAVESLDGLMNVCEEAFAGENLSALQRGGNDFWTPAREAFIRLLAAVGQSWVVLPEDSHV